MAAHEGSAGAPTGGDEWFTTTHWSLVLAAGQTSAPGVQEALEKLCRSYWYPLYAFVRRQGHTPHDAQDLTQAFFARLLEKNYLGQVHPGRGKFRSFLLAALKHFLSDEWDKMRAVKRGGGQVPISLDDQSPEDRYRLEPVDEMNAEKIYDRRWASTVMERVRVRLRQEYAAGGKGMLYYRLRVLESGEATGETYAQVAEQMGMTESAIKSAVLRMRRRFGDLLRDEIAHTVATPAEIDEEVRYLLELLAE